MEIKSVIHFSCTIKYNLEIKYDGKITIILHVSNPYAYKTFSRTIDEKDISILLKTSLSSMEKVFEFLRKQENFIVDPVYGKINLKLSNTKDCLLSSFEITLNWTQVKQKNLDEESKFGDDLSLEELNFPSYDEESLEDFETLMKKFDEEVQQFKKQFQQKMQKAVTKETDWELQGSYGKRYFVTFQGQWENGAPNGVGRCTYDHDTFGKVRLEGEWKNGKGHGIIITYYEYSRQQYEMTDGKFHGRYRCKWNEGQRLECEYRNGQYHGRKVCYNPDGTINFEEVYNMGELVK